MDHSEGCRVAQPPSQANGCPSEELSHSGKKDESDPDKNNVRDMTLVLSPLRLYPPHLRHRCPTRPREAKWGVASPRVDPISDRAQTSTTDANTGHTMMT